MALGQILREARISRGYTESEVAERIKMNAQMIVDIEEENYSRIAAPIYGKGYVRKYAEFLGLDYRPLVEEFKIAFGDGTIEKPAVPLDGFDQEKGIFTKIVPTQATRFSADVQQQPSSTVQSISTPEQVVATFVASESLFSEYPEPIKSNQEQKQEASESTEEVFVPAHLATTPPTPSIPPANTIPDSVAQSRYTFSPEKFTPRTTVFKPEQLPSADAPEPIALNVAPFSYPEPEGINDFVENEQEQTIIVSSENEEDSLFSEKPKRSHGPILSKYSGQTRNIEPEPIEDYNNSSSKKNIQFKFGAASTKIFENILDYFKDIFSTSTEEDLTKMLARKQRRLGFVFTIIIIVILITIFSFNKGQETQNIENEFVENKEEELVKEEIPNLVEEDKSGLIEEVTEPVEVVQILPTPKGFY